MSDAIVTRICGISLLLSAVLGFIAAPIAASIGYPMFVDFGDGEVLSRLAATAPAPFLFGLLQICLPTLALAGSLGFYYLLRSAGALVVLGVMLNALGLVFTTIQDGIEVVLVYYLPTSYVVANETVQPALLAIGGFGTTAMGVFARIGIVGYVGLLMVNWGMWRLGRWRWVAALYFIVFVLITVASFATTLIPALGIAFPLGFMGLRIWMISAAVLMLRAGPDRGSTAT